MQIPLTQGFVSRQNVVGYPVQDTGGGGTIGGINITGMPAAGAVEYNRLTHGSAIGISDRAQMVVARKNTVAKTDEHIRSPSCLCSIACTRAPVP